MMALSSGVDPSVCKELRAAVSRRGMRWFLTNELVARGAFNTSWTSGMGPAEQWAGHLVNRTDLRLVLGLQTYVGLWIVFSFTC